MRLVVLTLTLGLLVALARSADAQVVQSFHELAQLGVLQPGDKIELRGPLGQEAKGVFRDFRNGALVLFEPDRGTEATFAEADVQRIRRTGGHAAVWGTLVGAAAAIAVTSAAAARYGENEGGGFCGGCFLQWSVVSVPVGTAIGAGIGFALDRARRRALFVAPPRAGSIVTRPLISPRGAGILVTATF